MMSKKISKILFSLIIVICLVVILLPKTISAQQKKEVPCEQKLPYVNLRAQLLERYKKTSEDNYQIKRDKWSKRTAYSGQWVPKDAEKTRLALYRLDDLHRKHVQEIDKQIEQFVPLETNPVNCTNKKADLEKYLKLARGESSDKGKKLTGQLLLTQLEQEVKKYDSGEFKKISEKMMKNQQKAKKKQPKPKKSMTVVEEYKN